MNNLVFTNNWLAKLILLPRYHTIMLFGMIFSKLDTIDPIVLNHENIHRMQWLECALLALVFAVPLALAGHFAVAILLCLSFFYLLYGFEYLVSAIAHLFVKEDNKQCCEYRSVSFEQEARYNEDNLDYLSYRRSFSWLSDYGSLHG